MTKIARQNDKDDHATQSRESLNQAGRVAGAAAVAETDRLARAASGNGANEAVTSLLDILGDQTRHAIEAATALGRTRTLTEAAQVQSDFLSGSFGRVGRLSEGYLALLRSGMAALPPIPRR